MILDRYIIRSLISTTFAMSFIMTGMLWLMQSLNYLDLLVNKGFSFLTFLILMFCLFPRSFGALLPGCFFISVLFVYWRLFESNELIAFKFLGANYKRLISPAVKASLIFSVFLILLNFWGSPFCLQHFQSIKFKVLHDRVAIFLQEGKFQTDQGLTVYIHEKLGENQLNGIFIYDERQKDKTITLTASKAFLEPNKEDSHIHFLEGSRQEINLKTQKISFMRFKNYVDDLSLFDTEIPFPKRHVRDQYINELIKNFRVSSAIEQDQIKAEVYQRVVIPLLCIIFGFIAASSTLIIPWKRHKSKKYMLPVSFAAIGIQLFLNMSFDLENRSPFWLIGTGLGILGIIIFYIVQLKKTTLLKRG